MCSFYFYELWGRETVHSVAKHPNSHEKHPSTHFFNLVFGLSAAHANYDGLTQS